MGGKRARISELERDLANVKEDMANVQRTNKMLEDWRELWLNGLNEEEQIHLQTNMGALHSLFRKLNVQDMTSAVMVIEALQKRPQPAASNSLVLGLKQDLAESKFHLDNARARIAGLINQQHGDAATNEQLSWDMANLKQRNGELEEALRHVAEIIDNDLIKDNGFSDDYFPLHSVCVDLVGFIGKMDVFPPAAPEGDL